MSDDLLAQCKRLAQKRFDEGAVVSPVIVLTTVDIAERERAILTDLIADLREVHTTPTRGLVPYLEGDGWCGGCGEWLPCPTLRCADRAEQRLREFGDE